MTVLFPITPHVLCEYLGTYWVYIISWVYIIWLVRISWICGTEVSQVGVAINKMVHEKLN